MTQLPASALLLSSALKELFRTLQELGYPWVEEEDAAGPGPRGKMLCRATGKMRQASIRHGIIIIIIIMI